MAPRVTVRIPADELKLALAAAKSLKISISQLIRQGLTEWTTPLLKGHKNVGRINAGPKHINVRQPRTIRPKSAKSDSATKRHGKKAATKTARPARPAPGKTRIKGVAAGSMDRRAGSPEPVAEGTSI